MSGFSGHERSRLLHRMSSNDATKVDKRSYRPDYSARTQTTPTATSRIPSSYFKSPDNQSRDSSNRMEERWPRSPPPAAPRSNRVPISPPPRRRTQHEYDQLQGPGRKSLTDSRTGNGNGLRQHDVVKLELRQLYKNLHLAQRDAYCAGRSLPHEDELWDQFEPNDKTVGLPPELKQTQEARKSRLDAAEKVVSGCKDAINRKLAAQVRRTFSSHNAEEYQNRQAQAVHNSHNASDPNSSVYKGVFHPQKLVADTLPQSSAFRSTIEQETPRSPTESPVDHTGLLSFDSLWISPPAEVPVSVVNPPRALYEQEHEGSLTVNTPAQMSTPPLHIRTGTPEETSSLIPHQISSIGLGASHASPLISVNHATRCEKCKGHDRALVKPLHRCAKCPLRYHRNCAAPDMPSKNDPAAVAAWACKRCNKKAKERAIAELQNDPASRLGKIAVPSSRTGRPFQTESRNDQTSSQVHQRTGLGARPQAESPESLGHDGVSDIETHDVSQAANNFIEHPLVGPNAGSVGKEENNTQDKSVRTTEEQAEFVKASWPPINSKPSLETGSEPPSSLESNVLSQKVYPITVTRQESAQDKELNFGNTSKFLARGDPVIEDVRKETTQAVAGANDTNQNTGKGNYRDSTKTFPKTSLQPQLPQLSKDISASSVHRSDTHVESSDKPTLPTSSKPSPREERSTHQSMEVHAQNPDFKEVVGLPSDSKPSRLFPNKRITCHYWKHGHCRWNEKECDYAHHYTGLDAEEPPTKDKTCHWWLTTGWCKFREDECRYAHRDTGKYTSRSYEAHHDRNLETPARNSRFQNPQTMHVRNDHYSPSRQEAHKPDAVAALTFLASTWDQSRGSNIESETTALSRKGRDQRAEAILGLERIWGERHNVGLPDHLQVENISAHTLNDYRAFCNKVLQSISSLEIVWGSAERPGLLKQVFDETPGDLSHTMNKKARSQFEEMELQKQDTSTTTTTICDPAGSDGFTDEHLAPTLDPRHGRRANETRTQALNHDQPGQAEANNFEPEKAKISPLDPRPNPDPTAQTQLSTTSGISTALSKCKSCDKRIFGSSLYCSECKKTQMAPSSPDIVPSAVVSDVPNNMTETMSEIDAMFGSEIGTPPSPKSSGRPESNPLKRNLALMGAPIADSLFIKRKKPLEPRRANVTTETPTLSSPPVMDASSLAGKTATVKSIAPSSLEELTELEKLRKHAAASERTASDEREAKEKAVAEAEKLKQEVTKLKKLEASETPITAQRNVVALSRAERVELEKCRKQVVSLEQPLREERSAKSTVDLILCEVNGRSEVWRAKLTSLERRGVGAIPVAAISQASFQHADDRLQSPEKFKLEETITPAVTSKVCGVGLAKRTAKSRAGQGGSVERVPENARAATQTTWSVADEKKQMQQLQAQGVVFESDSESDERNEIPAPKHHVRPNDPLWRPPKTSEDLFEIAPEYAWKNVVLDTALKESRIAAKIAEIKARPNRKRIAKLNLAYSSRKRGTPRVHNEVDRCLSSRTVRVQLDQSRANPFGDRGDDTGSTRPRTKEVKMTFAEFLGGPKKPVFCFMTSTKRLAYRDGSKDTAGRRPRIPDDQKYEIGKH